MKNEITKVKRPGSPEYVLRLKRLKKIKKALKTRLKRTKRAIGDLKSSEPCPLCLQWVREIDMTAIICHPWVMCWDCRMERERIRKNLEVIEGP